MPIYEFRCENGHTQEVIDLTRAYVGVASMVCSQCGQVAMKVASVTNWQFGSGPKESDISRAIGKVRKAEREGRS